MNKQMQYDCEMVKDLLPLYHDRVCSLASKGIVEAHVAECPACREELRRLGVDVVDLRLQQARNDVVSQHTMHVKSEVKRKSVTVGTISAAVFALPILVCLIVNLATSHALDWFFIVLSSLAVVASLTVAPIIAPRKKALWTVGLFTLTLHLLLMTVCLYTGGDWFWVTSAAVLLGLTIFVLPFVIHQKPMPRGLARHKGLLVMLIATGLLYVLLFAIEQFAVGRYVGAYYWRNAMWITAACLPLPWAIFGIGRYMPMTKRGKIGLCLILSGLFSAVINNVIQWILDGGIYRLLNVDYTRWTGETVNDNINLLVCIVIVVIGLFLLAIQGRRKQ